MLNITAAALALGLCKLGFSTAMLALGAFRLGLGAAELQTLAFVTLVFGNQAVLFVVRERQHMWSSRPSSWVPAASAADIAIVSVLALSGILMEALAWRIMVGILVSAIGFALILDQVKLRIFEKIRIE
jgi:H+-transporting ATPase